MSPTLTPTQQSILNTASRKAVSQYLSDMDQYFHKGRWVGWNNRYRKDIIKQLDADLRAIPTSVRSKHLGEYIAASAILHCFDGWTFLSRALSAHIDGDQHTAHHLAYYAELRATMSLLASEGIGVFNRKHFVVDANKNCVLAVDNIRTHDFCWLALENWAKQRRSSDLLMDMIKPGGLTLQNWLTGFGTAPSSTSIGQDWLTSWGVDLKIVSLDHLGRNEVSYRPNYINQVNSITPIKASEFCRNFWELLEPSAFSRFEILDRHLLRISLRTSFKAVTGHCRVSSLRKRIEATVNSLNPKGVPPKEWIAFLARDDIHPLIHYASGTGSSHSLFHMPIIARAVLLLRIATGTISEQLTSVGYTSDDLKFWWEGYGESIGLWKPPLSVNFVGLWKDILDSLKLLQNWENAHQDQRDVSTFEWNQAQAKELDTLCTCERIGLWGLGI